MLKPLSIEKVEQLDCANKISPFKQRIDMKFNLQNQSEFYIQLNQDQICMVLYTIFGNFKQLQGDQQFAKLSQNTRKKIHNVFKKTQSLKLQYEEFVTKLRLSIKSIIIDQQLLEKQKLIWNRLAPRALAKSYQKVYFGLTQFDKYWQSPNLQEINKKVLIIPFKNKDKIILGFYETKKSFSAKQIHEIFESGILLEIQNQSENIVPKEIKKKKNFKTDRNEKEIMKGEAKMQNKQFFSKIPFDRICIILIIFLCVMCINTYFNPSSEKIHVLGASNSWIFRDGFFESEKKKISEVFDFIDLKSFDQGFKENREYFTNPLHNVTIDLNKKHPQIQEKIVSFTQGSNPLRQNV